MPIQSTALPVAPFDGAGSGEPLYDSPSTRVVRFGSLLAGTAVIRKEHLGSRAAQRLRTERSLLLRLAGIQGVAQLVEGPPNADFLSLRDSGAISLAQLLQAEQCDMGTVLSLACQLAHTLAQVHQAGVVHRDINPANILVSADREAVLIDFDLAVLADQRKGVDEDRQIVGTLRYMAPEQTGRTGHAVDQRADLYALGATLYEMAVGHPPFQQSDALLLIHDHLVREPDAPWQVDARVPPGLSNIIMRLMAKAPEQRYERLEQRVLARTRELQGTQAQLVTAARRAGMAEIANNVLHNVGNVFNSITVSTSMVRAHLAGSKLSGLRRALDLLNENEHDIEQFMVRDPRGKAWRVYLNELVDTLEGERREVLGDLDRLANSVDHVNNVLAAQQSHAGLSRVLDHVEPHQLVEEALRLAALPQEQGGVQVIRAYEPIPAVALDRERLLQILVNLITNAVEAMDRLPPHMRQLTLGVSRFRREDGVGGASLRFTVKDSGEGIAQENLARLFAHGFTTRPTGHGFGLHSSAVAAMEAGGKLTASSDGPGLGATFMLELPIGI